MSLIKRALSCCLGAPEQGTAEEQRDLVNHETQVPQPPQMQRRNSYASDFYSPQNIIGHTGDIDNNPTVYYLQDKQQGNQAYGHITTAHKKPDNVGKEVVRESTSYRMTHDGVSRSTGNTQTLVEWDANIKQNEHIHKSRNRFVPLQEENRQKLHEATQEHRNVKSRYGQQN